MTIELHDCAVEVKVQSYCSVDFDFLALMRFDMTFDVTLLDGSSFVNSQIHVLMFLKRLIFTFTGDV